MYKLFIKLSVMIAALVSLSTVQALPMSGDIGFFATGTFTGDGNGDASGITWTDNTLAAGNATVGSASGDFLSMLVPGSTATMTDFDLVNPPPLLEWTVTPVSVSGVLGNLIFQILNGGEVDISSGGSTDLGTHPVDLAGTGVFKFACTDSALACSGLSSIADTIDDTIGRWAISEVTSGGDLKVAFNVPAPATIGILGLGLLALGARRKRKAA